ncbi:MAG: DUF2934 domain-containing protein [Kiritimatiellia bacterium]|jgi:hypothetical protein
MAKKTAAKSVKKTTVPAEPKKAKTAPKAVAKPKAAPVAKKVPAPAPAPKAAPAPVKETKPAPKVISAQDRYHMIDEAAYYRAEKNGFQVDPHANWIAAEKEIDELLSKQNIVVG